MNPRQRRGVLLVVLAVLGMIAVFVLVGSYVSDVRSQVDPKVEVLALTEDARALKPVTPDMVELREVPERWAPENALTDPASLLGRVASAELPAGSYLQQGMLEPNPAPARGEREIAILVGADTGVAGRVQPGDEVDIEATFAATETTPQESRVVVSNARVVAVGLPEEVPSDDAPSAAPLTEEVVPITFAVSPGDTLQITYAEAFAEEVRLALKAEGDRTGFPEERRAFRLGSEGPEFSSGD